MTPGSPGAKGAAAGNGVGEHALTTPPATQDSTPAGREERGRPRRGTGRVPLVLTLVLGGLLAALAATRPWAQGTVSDPVLGTKAVAVTGSAAAPALLGLALAASAAGLVTAAAGRIARIVAALVAMGLGVGVAVLSVQALGDPGGVVARGASGAIGRAGHVPVAGATSTVWPYLATAAGVAVVCAAVGVLVVGRGFTGLSGRYDKPSDGSAGGHATPAPGGRGGAGTAEQPKGARHVSDWDRLSSGDDPTAFDDDEPGSVGR